MKSFGGLLLEYNVDDRLLLAVCISSQKFYVRVCGVK